MDNEQRQRKTVQQVIDDQEKKKPMRTPRAYIDNYRPSAHTRWHMEHIPYKLEEKQHAQDQCRIAAGCGSPIYDKRHSTYPQKI